MYDDENSLLKKLLVLWNGKKLIFMLSLLSFIASIIYAFRLPSIYKAECFFLPPNQDVSKLSVYTNAHYSNIPGRVGGLSDVSGLPDTVTGGQMMLGIIKRNTVLDTIIDRFSLMEVYKQKSRMKMREKFIKELLETNEDLKSGIISVGVLDKNPQRAADIANTLVETLQRKMIDLSLNEAVQRKVFFEEQLSKSRNALKEAENQMLEYQEKSGIAIPQSQLQARLASITELQRQIASKNVEISALATYTRPNNPKLRSARAQLEALTSELSRLEEEQKNTNPQLSIEYQRYAMNLELATKTYEAVLKQFEDARLDEAQGFFPLQIVDYASPPDVKYKPSRARIIILGTFLGFLSGCMIIVFSSFFKNFKTVFKKFALNHDNQNYDYENENSDGTELKKLNQKKFSGFFRKLFKFILYFAPAILFFAALMFLTFQNQFDSGALSIKFQNIIISLTGINQAPAWVRDMLVLRAFAHIPLYFALAGAIFFGLLIYGVSFFKAFLMAFFITISIGFADESVKNFIPGKEFDFIDWVLDIIGSFSGIIFISILKFFEQLFIMAFFKRKEEV